MNKMDSAVFNEFLLKYPGLLPSDKQGTELSGNVKIKGKWYRLRLTSPEFPSISGLKMKVSCGLQVFDFESEHFNPTWTIWRLIDEIPNLVNSRNRSEPLISPLNICQTQNEILRLVSPSYKIHTNSQCDIIRFSNFERFKDHFFELRLNSTHQFAISDHSLPNGIQWEDQFLSCNSIESYLSLFLKLADELRDFYTNLADIDELCYVVEPISTTTKHNWRIFKLKDGVFVKLVLDPFTSAPALVNVIGPTYEVEPLRCVLSEGLRNWDTEVDVHANLLRMFELTYFPMPDEDAEQHCNICFSYQTDGRVPLVSCDNRNCSVIFHASCLKEWFATLADGKTFLDVTFGICPYCKETLSASFEDILK